MKIFDAIFGGKVKGSVTIDGRSFSGRSISIDGDVVVVDGVVQQGSLVGPVKTMSGDVRCNDVHGDVGTMSGDVTCNTITGNVKTMSGDISSRR